MSLRPALNEVEISIFGKGYGESILLHPGNNEWIIIDSFKDPYTKEPFVLEYLKRIGVDYKNVKAIVATHWHDDHIGGLGKIVSECTSADFICSDAIKADDFLTVIFADYDLIEGRPGNQELKQILNTLEKRKTSPVWAVENKIIISNSVYKLCSLSPSDYAILLSKQEIKKFLPKEAQSRMGLPNISPNNTSVVLLLIVDNKGILLGGDLEEQGDARLGWSKILQSIKFSEKSHSFKIPHHGSHNAHHEGIWKDLLEKNPMSFLTSFVRGKTILPTRADIKRITSYTNNAWITTNPYEQKRSYKRDNMIERTIKETVKSIKSISDTGQIRMRFKPDTTQPEINLVGSARNLSSCLN
jgi:glutaredoxin-related protein